MDIKSLTEGVISELIASALIEIVALIGRKGQEALKQKENLRQHLRKDTSLAPILQKATTAIAKSIQPHNKRQAEKLRIVLVSPEVDAIVRQIYASQIIQEESGYLESIRAELLTILSIRLGMPEENIKDLTNHLFGALVKGCERALTIAIDKGVLAAHEAKSAARHRLVLDELATIKKNLALLTAADRPNIQAILEFEEKYRQQVGSRHSHITPPHFDAARKLHIDNLYVSPNFVAPPKERGQEQNVLKKPEILSVLYRAVLLGNPGGGKSTFASKLCYDLATHYSERLFAGRQVIPILVILRDYGAESKTRNYSILQFIEATANSKYQVHPPPGAFEYLLLNGRVLIIFDGLDELLDTSYRKEISGNVESFCSLYPSVPVLVTSRKVGYEQAPLDEKIFETFHLADFNEAQVQEYTTKWFAADADLTPEQQKQTAGAFLQESRVVSDLRSNPLMLALMCNIYRGENYIPKNRPDVYEKCAMMLFERWDKSRGIHVLLPFEAHIRPAMMYLAHWIYADEGLQGGVSERDLVAKATEYLCQRRFEDREEAEKAAREFIEFCSGRAWVFTDTGTTQAGERLYQFTHRTFLEYFTAAYMVRTHATPDRLGPVLQPKITKREWDVVAQLAFQLQNRNIEGAGDELLTALLKQAAETNPDDRWNLLSFAARCLEFMVPSPKLTREITTACIECCFTWEAKQPRREKSVWAESVHEKRHARELLGDLLNAAAENRPIVSDTLEKALIERVNSGNEQEALLALEVGLHLYIPLHGGARRERMVPPEARDFWTEVSDHIYDSCSHRIEALYPKHFAPSRDALIRGKISIKDLTAWHGIASLFRSRSYSMFPGTRTISPAHSLLHSVLSPHQPNRWSSPEKDLLDLEEAGRILLFSPPPWIRSPQFARHMFPGLSPREFLHQENNHPQQPLDLSPAALFGAFVLIAPMLEVEVEVEVEVERVHKQIKNQEFNFASLHWLFLARFNKADTIRVQAEMDSCGFTGEQQAFAWRWIRREFDLVQKAPGKSKDGQEDLQEDEEIEEQ